MDLTAFLLSLIFLTLGIIELIFTYQYTKKVNSKKIKTLTAPLVIWSGIIVGAGLIIIPFVQIFHKLKYINPTFSVISTILFLIVAVWTFIRAHQMSKKLKLKTQSTSYSWSIISAYLISIIALITGIISLI